MPACGRPPAPDGPLAADLARAVAAVPAARATEVLGHQAATWWLRHLPATLDRACAAWGLRPDTDDPLPQGRGGLVLAVHTHRGRAVLKAPFTDGALHAQAQLAMHRAGTAPAVWSASGPPFHLLLLERVDARPVSTTPPAEVTDDVARTLARLRGATAPPYFPRLVDVLRDRVLGDPRDVAPGVPAPTVTQRHEALARLDALGACGGACHGDANPGNVLVGPLGVHLVDARGVRGEPEYDLATFMTETHRQRTRHELLDALRATAHRAGLDAERAAAWVPVLAAARL